MGGVENIEWRNPAVAAPAFITIVVIPATSNVAYGVFAGLAASLALWIPSKLLACCGIVDEEEAKKKQANENNNANEQEELEEMGGGVGGVDHRGHGGGGSGGAIGGGGSGGAIDGGSTRAGRGGGDQVDDGDSGSNEMPVATWTAV